MRIQFKVILIVLLSCQCCYAQHWQSLNNGVNRTPTSLFVDSTSNKLYVAGNFTIVDGQNMWGIAAWNGSQWDSLGHGIDHYSGGPNFPGNTWAMETYGGDLHVGGNFTWVGDSSQQAFAKWSGSNWDTVQDARFGEYEVVNDILAYNGDLYVCGTFDSVGNVPANQIARWNGSSWTALGSNYNFGTLLRMCFYHGNLYVSGVFTDPSGNACRLAKWDGSTWTFMSNAIVGGIADIWDMIVYDNQLFVAGLFFSSAGNVANSIVSWNDTTWNDVGGSVQINTNPYPTICDMTVHNGKLYCVGNFDKIGGIPANSVAAWDGNAWCGFGTYFDNKITQVAFFNDTMYVSGGFLNVDSLGIAYIAKWIGGSFVDTCENTIGIEETNSRSEVVVYPNPSSMNTTFQFSDSAPRTIIISDQLGREIWRKETSESTVQYPAEEFSDGMYFYTIVGEGLCSVTGKFLIEH